MKHFSGKSYSPKVAAQLQQDVDQFRDQSAIENDVGSMEVNLGRARSAVDGKRLTAVDLGDMEMLGEATAEGADLGLYSNEEASALYWEGQQRIFSKRRDGVVAEMPQEVLKYAENPEAKGLPAEFAGLGKATWGELRLKARESMYKHQHGLMEDFREAVRSSTVRDDSDAEVWAEMHVPEGCGMRQSADHPRGAGGARHMSRWQTTRYLVELAGLFSFMQFEACRCQKTHYCTSMPVASEISRIQYTGNGSWVTPYSVPFYFLNEEDIKVVLTDGSGVETALTETTHYVLTGAGEAGGGSLTTVMAYDGTHTLTIYREPEQTQSAEFQSTGALPADTLTRGLDKLTMLVQSLSRKVARCFRLNDKAGDVEALSEATKANTVFGFGAGGDPVLRDRVALLSLLSLSGSLQGAPTTFWSNDGERALKVPDFLGQLGLQLNTSALYRSSGSSAGSWSLLIRDEDDMAGNDAVRAPSQQSVKAYVDARDAVCVATAQAADAAYLPAGAVIPFAGTVSPSGWLLCYGQAVSRATYGTLFAAVGTTYGAGDGSTTFNVPDLRGRAVAGKDDMGGSAASRLTNSGTGNPGVNGSVLGAAGGADRHQLTIAQMPAHSHSIVYNNSIGAAASGVILGSNSGSSTGSTGGDQAHPNVQPTFVLNYIIRT